MKKFLTFILTVTMLASFGCTPKTPITPPDTTDTTKTTESLVPYDFADFYHKAEEVYALFTGCETALDYTGERITYNKNSYDAVKIDGISSLDELRAICKKYFSDELTDSFLSKEVIQGCPVYIEQDGKLYRFGGYVAQSAPTFPNGIEATLENAESGIYTVRIDTIGVENGREIPLTAYCSYTLDNNGALRFKSFDYLIDVWKNIYFNSSEERDSLSDYKNEAKLDALFYEGYTVELDIPYPYSTDNTLDFHIHLPQLTYNSAEAEKWNDNIYQKYNELFGGVLYKSVHGTNANQYANITWHTVRTGDIFTIYIVNSSGIANSGAATLSYDIYHYDDTAKKFITTDEFLSRYAKGSFAGYTIADIVRFINERFFETDEAAHRYTLTEKNIQGVIPSVYGDGKIDVVYQGHSLEGAIAKRVLLSDYAAVTTSNSSDIYTYSLIYPEYTDCDDVEAYGQSAGYRLLIRKFSWDNYDTGYYVDGLFIEDIAESDEYPIQSDRLGGFYLCVDHDTDRWHLTAQIPFEAPNNATEYYRGAVLKYLSYESVFDTYCVWLDLSEQVAEILDAYRNGTDPNSLLPAPDSEYTPYPTSTVRSDPDPFEIDSSIKLFKADESDAAELWVDLGDGWTMRLPVAIRENEDTYEAYFTGIYLIESNTQNDSIIELLKGAETMYIDGRSILLYSWLSDNGFHITKYAVIDLDGNGEDEYVLYLDKNTNEHYGSLVLHTYKERIIAHLFKYAQFMSLKEDGTFSFSSGVPNTGVGKLAFANGKCTTVILAHNESNKYFIGDVNVSADEYNKYINEHYQSNDVTWYNVDQSAPDEIVARSHRLSVDVTVSLNIPSSWYRDESMNSWIWLDEAKPFNFVSNDYSFFNDTIKRVMIRADANNFDELKKQLEADTTYEYSFDSPIVGVTDSGYKYEGVYANMTGSRRYIFRISTDKDIYHLEIWEWTAYDSDSFLKDMVIPIVESFTINYEAAVTITDIADWDKLPWIEEPKERRKRAPNAYNLINNLVSGKSDIPEYNELGIKDYSITLLENSSLGTVLSFTFTVKGNFLPETLPPGTYTKILSETIDVFVYDSYEEYKTHTSDNHNLGSFADNPAVDAVHTYLCWMPYIYEISPHGEWDMSNRHLPYNYISAFYGNESLVIGFEELQKLMLEKFGITVERPAESCYLSRCKYDKETDTVYYADTRGYEPIHRFIDYKAIDGTAYVTVQLYADRNYLLPSHKVTYKIGADEVFLDFEITEQGKYEPNSMR